MTQFEGFEVTEKENLVCKSNKFIMVINKLLVFLKFDEVVTACG